MSNIFGESTITLKGASMSCTEGIPKLIIHFLVVLVETSKGMIGVAVVASQDFSTSKNGKIFDSDKNLST